MSNETMNISAERGGVHFDLRVPKELNDKMSELREANPEKYSGPDGRMNLVHDAADALKAQNTPAETE